MSLDPLSSAPGVFLAFAVLMLAPYLLVLPHELGHMLAARLAGYQPIALVVGRAPWWIDRPIGGIRVRIGRWLDNGHTSATPGARGYTRWRHAVISAGGPLVNIAIAALAFMVIARAPARWPLHPGDITLGAIGLASAWGAVTTLWPRHGRFAGREFKTDGAHIIDAIKGRLPPLSTYRGSAHWLRAIHAFDDREFSLAAQEAGIAAHEFEEGQHVEQSLALRAMAVTELGDVRGAIEILKPLLEAAPVDRRSRNFVEREFAWAHLLFDEARAHVEALAFAQRALALVPWDDDVIITCAALLAVTATTDDHVTQSARLLTSLLDFRLSLRSRAHANLATGLLAAANRDWTDARAALGRARAQGAAAVALRLLERRIPSS